MATFSSIGVGSNLPLDSLLTDLRNNQNTALVAIQAQKARSQSQISAYGKLKSVVTTLQGTIAALGASGTYGTLKASTGSDAFSAKATSAASAGKYNIQVNALATSQTLTVAGQASKTNAIGAGGQVTITLAGGGSKTLDLTGKDTSLNGLVSAINADSSLGIQATLVNDGSANPHRLLLTAIDTGANASVATISVANNTALQAVIGFDHSAPAANIAEQTATNASLTINGILVTGQSNKFTDAIEGVTLTLNKVNITPETLTLARDDSAASKAVADFVAAYNGLQSTLKSLTAYDIELGQSQPLAGDNVARAIQTQVRDVVNVVSPTGAVRTLSQLGISTDSTTGVLTIDNNKLAAAIAAHPDDVENLLSGANGVAKKLGSVTDNILSSTGLLSTATDGATRVSGDWDKKYTVTQQHIDAVMANYERQFTALDKMMSEMGSISNFLTQQLSMLGTQSKN